MMKIELPVDVANQILGYLGTRPYQEVFHLIQAMQDAAKSQLGVDDSNASGELG